MYFLFLLQNVNDSVWRRFILGVPVSNGFVTLLFRLLFTLLDTSKYSLFRFITFIACVLILPVINVCVSVLSVQKLHLFKVASLSRCLILIKRFFNIIPLLWVLQARNYLKNSILIGYYRFFCGNWCLQVDFWLITRLNWCAPTFQIRLPSLGFQH